MLGLGRIFQLFAEVPEGHAPEVTQFYFANLSKIDPTVDDLVRESIRNLVMVRFTGTKLAQEDSKEYDYMIHPIFSAFLGFNFRKKRKFAMKVEEFLGLVENPSETIRSILGRHKREVLIELPDQITLFESYFNQ